MARPPSRKSGKAFEDQIEATFPAYFERGEAALAMMPVPTRVIDSRRGMPIRIATGKAPFDVYGYLLKGARMIGAELKASVPKKRLPIVAPNGAGDGLKFHQLEALAMLARSRGLARIVWDNGGRVGCIYNAGILEAHRLYMDALNAQAAGKRPPPNCKGIPWERFVELEFENMGGVIGVDWLMVDK